MAIREKKRREAELAIAKLEIPSWLSRLADNQPTNDNYTTLRTILDAAYAHAATGKGRERHARDLPFDKQPMMTTARQVGVGFPLGQAIKKAGESVGMIERGQYGAAEAECLGAINYLAGAVLWMRERKDMVGVV
jgi:hypothetical protein